MKQKPRIWVVGERVTYADMFFTHVGLGRAESALPDDVTFFTAPWSGRYEITSEGIFALDPPPHDPHS